MHRTLINFILSLIGLFSSEIQSQNIKDNFVNAFSLIESMLSGHDSINFKKAVFVVEKAYLGKEINEAIFNNTIQFHTSTCRGIMNSGNIIYPEKDKDVATAQCAVFLFMTDTIPLVL